MCLVNENTTLKELYLNSKCLLYKHNLFFGWDYENDNTKISSINDDVYPTKSIIDSLNKLSSLDKDGFVNIIKFSSNEKLDFILIKQKDKSKVAIVSGGGGYSCVCNGVEALPVAINLFLEGYSVVIPTYSINEECKYGRSTLDFIDLISFLSKEQEKLNIDMRDYLIGGFSSAGHVIGLLLTKDFSLEKNNLPKPKLMFLCYPVITMGEKAHIDSRNLLLGKAPSKDNIKKFSIERGLEKAICKLYFWQCEEDNVVPFENFLLLKNAARKSKYDFKCRSYKSNAHGWGIATEKLADGWIKDMLDFANKK